MQVTESGSVRVDLLGGTLDLEPINLILSNAFTLNVATSLQANVTIEKNDTDEIEIQSLDYGKDYKFKIADINRHHLYESNTFKEMTFILQVLDLFGIEEGMKLTLSSGAPAGSGLGGSSAMGIVLHKALSKMNNETYSIHETVLRVKGVEARILNQGVPGYQDYYPALTGGILALRGAPGKIIYEQLYTEELATFLEQHITLVYSGISRDSGINNWDVYKRFFDGDERTRVCLQTIADLSYRAFQAIEDKHYGSLLELIHLEGQARKDLAPNIAPKRILDFFHDLESQFKGVGFKMCGAGGGGCFIVTHSPDQKSLVNQVIQKHKMQALDFHILEPKENS